jgi:hypothetical protein
LPNLPTVVLPAQDREPIDSKKQRPNVFSSV